MKVHIDFETRSEADIWAVGAWKYSCHPSTEILCMALAIDDREVAIDVNIDTRCPVDTEAIFVAHNAFFEQAIWANILVKRYGWPRIPIKQWRCSAAKAAARSLPRSLYDCAKALNTPHQKDMTGKGVMLRLAKSKGKIEPFLLEKLYAYCKDDVETERDIDNALPDLTENEQIIWFHDQLINQRGVCVDRESCESAIRLVSEHTQNLNRRIVELTDGALDGVSRRTAVMNWIKKQGVDIEGYTKKDVQEILSQNIPENVRTVLETRVQLGKTSVKKYEAISNAADEDGRLRDLLLYHGANTGRWTGKLVQIQNLPSSKGDKYDMENLVQTIKQEDLALLEMMYGDVMGWISKAIRGMFMAEKGKKLLVADYNAIEARVLFWLADDKKGLSAYQENRDIYVDMAREIYGKQEISKGERQLGKIAVLGCGYGMGKDKFQATCANFGIKINEELSLKAVGSYRKYYQSVTALWYAVEQNAIQCVQTRQPAEVGRIRWMMDGTTLLCRLPSGRAIAYNEACYKDGKLTFKAVNNVTHQWEEDTTYGGKLVENIVQGIARDVLAEALLRVEYAGYPIVMHVHDEAVAETTKDLKTYVELLEVVPEWAKGLPLKVEGFETRRYSK